MNVVDKLASSLISIIDIARLAPSVHNTQPWRVKLLDDSLIVSVDSEHTLLDGDPTGRQTVISLGIFCEALVIAAQTEQLGLKELTFDTSNVTLQFELIASNPASIELARLLAFRHSDRSIYTPTKLSADAIHTLKQSVTDTDVKVWVISNQNHIRLIADLTSRGISLALSSPNFRHELTNYIVRAGSKKARGISVKSLYLSPILTALQPRLLKSGTGLAREAELEKRRWTDVSADIILTTPGDMPKYWFKTGRSYLQLSLTIAGLGLAQATSAAIVEASNYHDDIEAILQTDQRILALLRVGNGSNRHYHSPRISSKEILR